MTGLLQFDVAEIRARGHLELDEELAPELLQPLLEDDPLLTSPLHADLELTARGGEIEARGRLSGAWKLECGRCGERAETRYEADVEASLPAGEQGLLDLSEEVRQTLILAAPMIPLCREDCKGRCPTCRANLNLKSCSCKEKQ